MTIPADPVQGLAPQLRPRLIFYVQQLIHKFGDVHTEPIFGFRKWRSESRMTSASIHCPTILPGECADIAHVGTGRRVIDFAYQFGHFNVPSYHWRHHHRRVWAVHL